MQYFDSARFESSNEGHATCYGQVVIGSKDLSVHGKVNDENCQTDAQPTLRPTQFRVQINPAVQLLRSKSAAVFNQRGFEEPNEDRSQRTRLYRDWLNDASLAMCESNEIEVERGCAVGDPATPFTSIRCHDLDTPSSIKSIWKRRSISNYTLQHSNFCPLCQISNPPIDLYVLVSWTTRSQIIINHSKKRSKATSVLLRFPRARHGHCTSQMTIIDFQGQDLHVPFSKNG